MKTKKLRKKQKNKKGFTLVELIAVIAIIGILSTIAVISFTSISRRTKEKEYEALVGTVKVAAYNFYDATKLSKFYVQTLIDYGLLSTDNNASVLTNPVNDEDINCYVVNVNDDDFSLTENTNCSLDLYESTRPIVKLCGTNTIFDSSIWHNYNELCLEPELPNDIKSQGINIKDVRWEDDNNGNNIVYGNQLKLKFNRSETKDYKYKLILTLDSDNITAATNLINIKNDLSNPNIEINQGVNCGTGLPVTIKYTDTGSGLNKIEFNDDIVTSFPNKLNYSKEYYITSSTNTYYISAVDIVGNKNYKSIYLNTGELTPSISISVKDNKGNLVNSDKWINSHINFNLNVNWQNDICTGTIKYCIDDNNTCMPNISVSNNETIYLNNEGIFYIRYEAESSGGIKESGSFKAKVDPYEPNCIINDNRVWKKGTVTIDYGCNANGASGCYIVGQGNSSLIYKDFTETSLSSYISTYSISNNAGLKTTCNGQYAYVYLDNTNPEIIGDIVVTNLGNKQISIQVSAKDDDSGVKSIKYEVNGVRGGFVEYTADNSDRNQYRNTVNNTKTIDLNTFLNSDSYTINVIVSDAVGNTISKSINVNPDIEQPDTARVNPPIVNVYEVPYNIDITNSVTITNMTRSNNQIKSNSTIDKSKNIVVRKMNGTSLETTIATLKLPTNGETDFAFAISKNSGELNKYAEIVLGNNFIIRYKLPDRGDINFNSSIDVNDYTMLKRYNEGTLTLDKYQLRYVDANCDGVGDSSDTDLINKIVKGTSSLSETCNYPNSLIFLIQFKLSYEGNNIVISNVSITPTFGKNNSWTNQSVALSILPGIYVDYTHDRFSYMQAGAYHSIYGNSLSYTAETDSSGKSYFISDKGNSNISHKEISSSGTSASIKIDKTSPVFNSDFVINDADLFSAVQCWQADGADGRNSNTWPSTYYFRGRSIDNASCKKSGDNYNPNSTSPRYMYIHYPVETTIDNNRKEIVVHYCQFANKLSKYNVYFNSGSFNGNSPYYDALSGIPSNGISTSPQGEEIKSYKNGISYCGKSGAPCIREHYQVVSDRAGNTLNGYKIIMVTHYYENKGSSTANEWDTGRDRDKIGNYADTYYFDCRKINTSNWTDTVVLGKKEVYDNGTWKAAGYCRNSECTSSPYNNFPRTVAP